MGGLISRPDRQVAKLLEDFEKATRRGESDEASIYLIQAANTLVENDQREDAISLCAEHRHYKRAAELAEEGELHAQSAEFWFKAGDFSRSGEQRMLAGEPIRAAELFEQAGRMDRAAEVHESQGDLTRAARMYDRLGNKRRAAALLERALRGEEGQRLAGPEATEAARRAGVLYGELGDVQAAIQVLKAGGQIAFAGELLASAGQTKEAVNALVEGGDYLTAAEIARASGDERRASLLLAERAENEGRLADAAEHQSQAGEHLVAARLFEFAGEEGRAAAAYEAGEQHETAARIWTRLGETALAANCLRAAGQVSEAEKLEGNEDRSEDSIRRHVEAKEWVEAAEILVVRARAGDRDRYDEAQGYLEQVPPQSERYFDAQVALAELLEELGHSRRALSILQRLFIGNSPKEEHVHGMYLYGRLLEKEGYLAGARNAYRTVAAFVPDYRDAKSRLHILREVDHRTSPGPSGHPPTLPMVVGEPAENSQPSIPAIPAASTGHLPIPSPRQVSLTMELIDLELAEMSQDLPAATPQRKPDPTADLGPVENLTGVPSAPPSSDLPVRRVAPPRHDTQAELRSLAIDSQEDESVDHSQTEEIEPIADDDIAAKRPAHPDALTGVVLRGRFRIERKLGRGAQAQVYLARDQVLDRPVAIKVLSESASQEDSALDRFLREARLAARINHSSCIGIYDFGQEHGLTFMAMEYFKGRTLRDLIKRGPMDPYLALRISRDVASALIAIHEAGIVHRDVKPTNVMVDRQGQVRIADFGVARTLDDSSSSGMMVGTMKYMAPEQARGKEVDARADIFSLGVVLYEMLCGKPPFGGTLDALIARVTKPPPPMPSTVEISDDLRSIVRTCMARKPNQRYDDVQELHDALAIEVARLRKVRRAERDAQD